ncbi:hypothetical protein VitviT2T_019627 [Vitis vinifera]|uniref:Integrase catalytic domain-containing protein n=1 Tax=Vitis vinifera TaxID=29760 RepID=A0ABY9D1E3_VITVI|nr:hypothetical protein VitviT2T_019627 [Vitis vinifera]
MVSERGIEVDLNKIKAILDMTVPKIEKEVRGFLGRLQYISRFIARLTNICEPIFRLLRKNQPTVWNDDCQLTFEKTKEYFLSPPVLVPPTPGRPLLLYLAISDMALGCMLAQIDESGKERAIYYLSKRMLEYEMRYVMIERLCLGDHILRSVRLGFLDRHPITNNIVEYEACILGLETALELDIRQIESVEPFSDTLATLASSVDIPIKIVVRPLLIELRSAPAYCCLIGKIEVQDDLPWYHDIYQFLRSSTYPEVATAQDRRALSDHEFILVTIDYFTKWVEVASYVRLTFARVASFIISHIICRYGVPHELISDRGMHFRVEVHTLLQEYGIRHHRSSAYRSQTNEAYHTSTGATPYSLVYCMEAVLPVEIEMGSLRVALEQHISEIEWAKARFDQLNLLYEKRLRATDHVQAY